MINVRVQFAAKVTPVLCPRLSDNSREKGYHRSGYSGRYTSTDKLVYYAAAASLVGGFQ